MSNFPRPVFEEWIEPYIKILGWPPNINSRWHAILCEKGINFWQQTVWNLEKVNLNEIIYSGQTKTLTESLRKNFLFNKDGSPKQIQTNKRDPSYFRTLEYLINNGKFPKPICLLNEKEEYTIVDGHHRFVAWEIWNVLPGHAMARWGIL